MPSIEIADRFWKLVGIGKPNDCWLWKGTKFVKGGYGKVRFGSRKRNEHARAHRIAVMLTREFSLDQLFDVHHRCGNPACCNPAHLEVLDHGEHSEITNEERA